MSKKIYNKDQVVAGLVIFIALVSFPFWYNHGKGRTGAESGADQRGKGRQGVRETDGIHEGGAYAAFGSVAGYGGP